MKDEMEFSLARLQEALKDGVTPEECEHFYAIWEKLNSKGKNLEAGLDKFLKGLPQDFSNAFPAVVAATEEWFHPDFNSHKNPFFSDITPIIVGLYDLLLSLKRSYEAKSAMSCALIARSIFEARVNLAEIEKKPEVHAPQFSKYKNVARLWNDYQSKSISQEEIISQLKSYPEWFDEDWRTLKRKIDNWTGIDSDSVRKMAERNELEADYTQVYKVTSKFAHFSPLIANYYSVRGNGPICSEDGVFELSFIALAQYTECLSLSWRIIKLSSDDLYGALNVPMWFYADKE